MRGTAVSNRQELGSAVEQLANLSARLTMVLGSLAGVGGIILGVQTESIGLAIVVVLYTVMFVVSWLTILAYLKFRVSSY
jgi:hypothetical protein